MTAEMQVGVFGKLPAKRDFLALNLPLAFRTPWENWMQESVAACRDALGARFQDQFLTAPLWRFWLGRGICGVAATGVFMPSVDGIGRYFPLCICACGAPGETIAPPPVNSFDAWHAAVEDRLLATLDPDYAFDAGQLLAGLELLQPRGTGGASAEALVFDLFAADIQDVVAGQSWWWTVGGEGFVPRVLRFAGLPDPDTFQVFLAAVDSLNGGPAP
jgi:type VI secretion system protein ImpM